MDVSEEHSRNGQLIAMIEAEMFIVVSEEQPSYVPSSIDETEFGKDNEESFEQFWNAYDPIDVTESGIVIAVRPEQL